MGPKALLGLHIRPRTPDRNTAAPAITPMGHEEVRTADLRLAGSVHIPVLPFWFCSGFRIEVCSLHMGNMIK
jgi:hypothetical protein